jgi:hypothetical protein
MDIEFATFIDDYNFKNIPENVLKALKENMICTLLYEKVQILKKGKPENIIENQTYWSLI